MSRLVHAGSAVVDYVYRIDALPSPGTEKIATSYDRVAGGGFNMMVAASRTGMQVVFAGQHGTGSNGDFLRAAFATEGIETLTPPAPALDSGNCVVLVSADAERTFVSWPGAEGVLNAARPCADRPPAGRLGVHLRLHVELSRQPRRAGRLDRGAAGRCAFRVRPDAGGLGNPEIDLGARARPHHLAELQCRRGGRRSPARTEVACQCRPADEPALSAGCRRGDPLGRGRRLCAACETAGRRRSPASKSRRSTPTAPATPISAPSSAR